MSSIPLPIASYVLPAPSASCSRLLNCLLEEAPPRTMKGDALLRRAPGIESWLDLAETEIDHVRGMTMHEDLLHVAVGTVVKTVDVNGNTETLDGEIPGNERVRIISNGTDLVVWRPFDNTAYNIEAGVVTQETDPQFAGGAASPVYIDGYLAWRIPGTDQFFNSGLNALTYNGLDIASAEAVPGALVGMHVDHREIMLPKSDCMELWYNAGNSPGSPFSRSPDGLIDIGTAAGDSLGSQDNSPFWLGADLTFRRLSGNIGERVSQHGIEAVLNDIRVSDAYTVQYFGEGHLCIAWIFPFAGRTLVYDCTTKQWHERDSLGYGAWRPSAIVSGFGRQIVGDRLSGKIGYLSTRTFEEFGEPQRISWTYQPVYAEAKLATHNRLELVPNTGSGTTLGQGQNPLCTLRISDDGGNIFRSHTTLPLGSQGKYRERVQWFKLGSSRNRVYQFQITDPVPVFAIDTQLDVVGARA